jgi:predicted aspartyl protease
MYGIVEQVHAPANGARGRTVLVGLLASVLLSGCALHNEVTIMPLIVDPSDIQRAPNYVEDHVAIGDFPRAIALAEQVEAKKKPTMKEFKALAEAELAAGRFDDARRHFNEALQLSPFRTDYGEIAWGLSQVEYWTKNFSAAHSWALEAAEHGLEIRQWWLGLLEALSDVRIHEVEGRLEVNVPIAHEKPGIPRVETRVNDTRVSGIIDSGAAMTIVSDRLAAEARLPFIGELTGTFYGLLNEPIEVRFAMIDRLRVADMTIRSIPVAVMSGEKMKFLTLNKTPFHIDMLLGANLLREFRLVFDYSQSRLTMEWLAPEKRRPDPDQNLFFIQGKPTVHATVDGKGWYHLVVDTGSEVTYLNSAEINRAQVGRSFAKVYRGAELQGLGGSTKRGIKVENVGIGIHAWEGIFKNLPLYSSPNSGALGLVGENFLKNFRVTMDFGRMKMTLDRTRYGS